MMTSDNAARPQGYWRVPQLMTDLPSGALGLLESYYSELLRFNGRLNLISRKTELDADILHFVDCILGGRIVLRHCAERTIYDLGSGNGLPGVVVAILDPNRSVVCVDSDERKVEFLKLMISRLGLKNCQAVRMRVEDLEAGVVGAAVTRGFANVSKALLVSRKIVKVGGEIYHFKGRNWVREVSEIPAQLCSFWAPRLVEEYHLPILGNHMGVVVTKRLA